MTLKYGILYLPGNNKTKDTDMTFKKELLLSQEGLHEFLSTKKSELKTIADEVNVGYSTLRNYAYGVTPISSMPYRLIEALTNYSVSEDLFHPKCGIHLQEPAFYALAKLSGRYISPSPCAFAIEEFTKAVLLLKQLEKQNKDEQPFSPRYFFIDLKYQNYFLNRYRKQFSEREHQLVLQTVEQLKNMYNWSDDDFARTMSQNDMGVQLRSTDPIIVNQLLSISEPCADDDDLWSLLRGDCNIHLIITNTTIMNEYISNDLVKEINNTFAMVERQDKYLFNGSDWMISPNKLISNETIAHMRGADFDELSLPNDEYVQEHIYRNLINLNTVEPTDNIWSHIVRNMLHKNWTLHHNLDLHIGSYMELIGDNSNKLVQSHTIANTLDKMAIETAEIIQKQICTLNKQG